MSFNTSSPLSQDLYNFYAGNSITCGLQDSANHFTLNKKPFRVLSGSLHYFRILPDIWEDRLTKMKRCGLNTVCTYIPWNLHEIIPGVFNFSGHLDLVGFIQAVEKAGLFLILRPGPYICAELDFGGLPSWLLHDRNMKVRSNNKLFLKAVKSFFSKLIPLVSNYQFSVSGGPLIAVQVENEFSSYGDVSKNQDDLEYLIFLKDCLTEYGIQELLFTCDMPSIGLIRGSLPGILIAANFQTDPENELSILKQIQPDKPLMVAEFWCGWFDHWGEKKNSFPVETYKKSLRTILEMGASLNIYVFHGGTNFGFTNGANIHFPTSDTPYLPTVTSYDYDALLTEAGDYTEKYFITKALIQEFCCNDLNAQMLKMPSVPISSKKLSVDDIQVTEFLPLDDMLKSVLKLNSEMPLPMEMLEFNQGWGQSFGIILYRTCCSLKTGKLAFQLTRGVRTIVLINSALTAVFESTDSLNEIELSDENSGDVKILDVLVENLGRVNFCEDAGILNQERRGLLSVFFDGVCLRDWSIFPLTFDSDFMKNIDVCKWRSTQEIDSAHHIGLSRFQCFLDGEILDTYIYSDSWTKGIVLINGFNLGRYWNIGPQETLYVPASLLRKGINDIMVFELHSKISSLQFKNSAVVPKEDLREVLVGSS